jgi:hypothetical protein
LASRVIEEDDGGEDQAKITERHLILARKRRDAMEVFAEQLQGGLMGRWQSADPFDKQSESFFARLF